MATAEPGGANAPPPAPDAPEGGPGTPVIEIRDVSKRFGSTQALADVSLALHPGEIHALLGENGAGKSTVIKIMTGVVEPDAGEVVVGGVPTRVASPIQAQSLGVAAIYQEPMMFPDLSVAENIFISHRDRGRLVDRAAMRRDAEAVLARLGVRLDLEQPARGLTLAEQQTLEIA
jgi:rhamnose transport system ATP-binding protein